MSYRLKDKVWIQQSFLLPDQALDEVDQRRRVMTSAAYKFTDTTLGGNFAINAPPQFTRYADVRVGGSQAYSHGSTNGSTTRGGVKWMISTGRFMSDDAVPGTEYTTPSAGMGRYYSEAIDDWGQDLVMRFGVPEFNSLTQFFGNFYSTDAAMLARTGRTSSLFATAGRAAGFLLALPLQPLILGGQIVKYLGSWPSSKYYYMKPTMYPYWQAVNTIVNGIAVNLGVIPMALTPSQSRVMGLDQSHIGNQEEVLAEYAKVLPDIFLGGQHQSNDPNRPMMGLDVYAIANRAQRIANSFDTAVLNQVNSLSDASNLFQSLNSLRAQLFQRGGLKAVPSGGIDAYRDAYLSSERNQPKTGEIQMNVDGSIVETADQNAQNAASASRAVDLEAVGPNGDRSWFNDFGGSLSEMFKAERRDGAQFVTFRVAYSGSTGESFASSVEESQISQKFNSTSSSSRQARFSWAGGLVDIPGVEQVLGAAKDFIAGTLDGIHMSGLLALAGNAFVDIPKTWSGSTADLPKATYTIRLRSPYGTRMSRLMNLYVPLAMLLAAALPLSTGKRSYTSPFICEAFCRGRHAIRLGMITDLSITRGVGNLAWSQEGDALGIDVTFTITDMSTVMHMPITTNFGATDIALQGVGDALGGMAGQELAAYVQKGTYDDDNAFTDYLAVLGSLSWQDLIYANRRWRLARYRQMQNWASWKSPARLSSWFGNTIPGRIWNAVSVETDRTD